ncbi:MAG: RHS repeat-associated core domain-containing protein, partial [Candidatus Koribacter versatilis]|nr:RHS repeat-associated core domain-containing protein [Candidatus Koribacter versatilis]
MTSDGTNAFAYDAENRLVNYNSGAATYVYGPDGLRIQKTVASDITTYIFSGFKVIAEYTGSTPALSQEYIYAGASLLATLDSSGTPAYRHMDHLSARLETDAGGSVTRTFGHFPYGETWYETGAASRQKFTTYERDGESQLDYANARSFIPRLGRFLTADPLAGSIGDPQTLGRYAYTAGDPINLSDPTGMQTCDSANTIEQKAACLLANQDGPSGGGGGWGGCAPWDASCSSSGFSYYNPNYAPSSAEQAYSAGVDWIFYVTSQGCKFTYGGSITCNGKVTPPSEFQAGFDAYLARFGYMNTGFTINRTVVDKGYCNIYCHYIFNTPDAAR